MAFTLSQAIAMCRDFSVSYPESAYGPAHAVIDDYNFDPDILRACLERCNEELKNYHDPVMPMQAQAHEEDLKAINKILRVPVRATLYAMQLESELHGTRWLLERLLSEGVEEDADVS